MTKSKLLIAAVIFLVTSEATRGQGIKKPSAAPQSLLIYYGWPSCINGANNVDGPNGIGAAAAIFSNYNYVVLGGGLEEPTHGDHLKARAIILTAKDTKFFGYIPLGNRAGKDKCLAMKEIRARAQGWSAMGVKGVLLDEFGFDYGVTRERQNDAVDAVHNAKLRVIANAWDPDHVLLPDPGGIKPSLKKDSDIYLWESYRFNEGKPVGLNDWTAKAKKIELGRKDLPLLIFSVSTNNDQPANVGQLFTHQWCCAAIDAHAATGWGHPTFGGNGQAPTIPLVLNKKNLPVKLGEHDAAKPAVIAGATVSRTTSLGEIKIDTSDLTGTFIPKKK
ncbi:hypothetical protein [Fimbriiglobus ruber]|uniref:hypothetical protein n=1 Tax=Fimbriiglobus ruber TaxID=1908690 RepID=UPI000B4C0342|nr:hypothetical protein [Fimbriiglobus ruber]